MEIKDIPGVGVVLAEKLKSAGFYEVMSIATMSVGELVEVSGLGDTVARKIIQNAREMCEGFDFTDGAEIEIKRKNIFFLTTSSKMFDEMMGGGFESGSIIECYSAFGGGKTQIAHQLAVNIQKNEYKGMAVFIDTENTFKPQRIRQMAKGQGLDENKVLKNIKYARAFNSDHQMLLAEKVEKLITEQKLPIKLLIIDSLTSHFRSEYVGRGTLAERQQKLNKHIKYLGKIADMYNLVVYITNQVSTDPAQMFGDPDKPIGGHIIGHASAYRIYLRRNKRGIRTAKLIDAPHLPDNECVFIIDEEGIKDVKKSKV